MVNNSPTLLLAQRASYLVLNSLLPIKLKAVVQVYVCVLAKFKNISGSNTSLLHSRCIPNDSQFGPCFKMLSESVVHCVLKPSEDLVYLETNCINISVMCLKTLICNKSTPDYKHAGFSMQPDL